MIPFLEFMLDKNFIISELCEQKDEELNICNGQCHLMSQIEKFNDDFPSDKRKLKSEKSEILFIEDVLNFEIKLFQIHLNSAFFLCELNVYEFYLDIPQPPPNFI